jgi:hypothetical protein
MCLFQRPQPPSTAYQCSQSDYPRLAIASGANPPMICGSLFSHSGSHFRRLFFWDYPGTAHVSGMGAKRLKKELLCSLAQQPYPARPETHHRREPHAKNRCGKSACKSNRPLTWRVAETARARVGIGVDTSTTSADFFLNGFFDSLHPTDKDASHRS